MLPLNSLPPTPTLSHTLHSLPTHVHTRSIHTPPLHTLHYCTHPRALPPACAPALAPTSPPPPLLILPLIVHPLLPFSHLLLHSHSHTPSSLFHSHSPSHLHSPPHSPHSFAPLPTRSSTRPHAYSPTHILTLPHSLYLALPLLLTPACTPPHTHARFITPPLKCHPSPSHPLLSLPTRHPTNTSHSLLAPHSPHSLTLPIHRVLLTPHSSYSL